MSDRASVCGTYPPSAAPIPLVLDMGMLCPKNFFFAAVPMRTCPIPTPSRDFFWVFHKVILFVDNFFNILLYERTFFVEKRKKNAEMWITLCKTYA